MHPNPDVVVVGAGAIGVSCAWYLAERGFKVVVIDSGEVGGGASHANAGLVVPSHCVPLAAPGVPVRALKWLFDPESPFHIRPRIDAGTLAWIAGFVAACRPARARAATAFLRALHVASAELHKELARIPGSDWDYAGTGTAHLYRDPGAFADACRKERELAELGVLSEIVTGSAVTGLVPEARGDVAGAIFNPEDARIDPGAFVRGLARLAGERGVRFLTETEVTDLSLAGGRVTAVKTAAGQVSAGEIVLAAGASSSRLGRRIGLGIPLQPAKGYSVTFPSPLRADIPLFLCEAKVAVTAVKSCLRLSGTLELAGEDLSVNRRRVGAVARAAGHYLSGASVPESAQTWAGMRPLTPDTLPMLGRAPGIANLTVATGHGNLGMTLAPVTGRIVAALAAGEEAGFDLALADPGRFGGGSRERRLLRSGPREPVGDKMHSFSREVPRPPGRA